jgi:hypothetical protein
MSLDSDSDDNAKLKVLSKQWSDDIPASLTCGESRWEENTRPVWRFNLFNAEY